MNLESEFSAFSSKLDDIWVMKGQSLTAGARAAFFQALERWPLNAVLAGLDAHVRDPERGRFLPMPADVIAQIDAIIAADGRPGAEEAWAIAMLSRDETETVVWTAEIAEALGIARPILDARDEVGARMAFKETYIRLVDEARRERRPATWSASLGFDPARRTKAICAGVEAGRLQPTALPPPEGPAVPLLELANAPGVPEHAREELRRLTESLRADLDKPGVDAKARAETEARKAEAAQKVQEYAADHGIDLQPPPAPAATASEEETHVAGE